ncbi:MAG: group 1 glycosyl transferase, partial [Mastigocladus sp. ERB_26_1]
NLCRKQGIWWTTKKAEKSSAKSSTLLQVHNQKLTTQEIIPLLSRYQLLPKLQQELIIDEAIASVTCTSEEQGKCYQDFCTQHQLTSEAERQDWLQQQGITETQFLDLATRNLRIEKFKQATWGSQLESYFYERKQQLDQVVYSLIRTRDAAAAQELYFRLLEDEQPFAEIAAKYSQGSEARTGGLIGPVSMSTPHPHLARILAASQPGQLSPPTRVGEWWIIVRLEKYMPVRLDESTQQQLLNELFASWLKEQLQVPQQQLVEVKKPA